MSDPHELPSYKCHKEVQAFKIRSFRTIKIGGPERNFLVSTDERHAPVEVSQAWLDNYQPHAGGYYVQDNDCGFFTPAREFEQGHTLIK